MMRYLVGMRLLSEPVSRLWLVGALLTLVGCGGTLIPGTDVPDSGENREAIDFVEQYRHAVEERNASAVLALVSPDYFDDNGTPNPEDDLDFERLREELGRWTEQLLQVRYEMRYRRVVYERGRTLVDVTFTGHFQVRTADGTRWTRRLSDNRVELVREHDEFRIISGL